MVRSLGRALAARPGALLLDDLDAVAGIDVGRGQLDVERIENVDLAGISPDGEDDVPNEQPAPGLEDAADLLEDLGVVAGVDVLPARRQRQLHVDLAAGGHHRHLERLAGRHFH